MVEVTWDENKNSRLKNERGISFEQIAYLMEQGKILDIDRHPNSRKYDNQLVCFVEIEQYVYAVPYLREGDMITLLTAFPSRKATKKCLGNPKGS